MKQIITGQDIRQLGTILSIWAHPDDETLSCAGIMYNAILNGQKVVCLTATKGEAGSQDTSLWPPETLGDTRAAELAAALKIIGVSEHHWLGYGDGECDKVNFTEATQKISKYIQTYKPDSILTFGTDGLTGHTDHQTVSRWVSQAVSDSSNDISVYHVVITEDQYQAYLLEADSKLNIFFNIEKPPIYNRSKCDILYNCDDQTCTVKQAAIAAMPSQTKIMFDNLGSNFIVNAFKVESFIKS
jgi:LmbE family N-acetylglucosaminyl deacetylase